MSLIELVSGQIELPVRGAAGSPTAWIRLFNWAREDEYHIVFDVEAAHVGLHACLEQVEVSVWDGLDDFFDGLARDYHGWDGERVCANNQLTVTATFRPGGHVCLSWTLQADVFSDDWKCTVSTVIEGGEEMATLAADLKAFLQQG